MSKGANEKLWCKRCKQIYRNNIKLFLRDFSSDIHSVKKYKDNPKSFEQYITNLHGNLLYVKEILEEKQEEIVFLRKKLNEIDLNNQIIAGKVKPQRKTIPASLRHEVFKRDSFRCVDCGATNKNTVLHVDHIVPVSQGGSDELDNLQTLCEECNLCKGNRAWKGEI